MPTQEINNNKKNPKKYKNNTHRVLYRGTLEIMM